MNSIIKLHSFLVILLLFSFSVGAEELQSTEQQTDAPKEPVIVRTQEIAYTCLDKEKGEKVVQSSLGKRCVSDQVKDGKSNLETCKCLNKLAPLYVQENLGPSEQDIKDLNEEAVGQHMRSFLYNTLITNYHLDSMLYKGVLSKGTLNKRKKSCNIDSIAESIFEVAQCGSSDGKISDETKRRLKVFYNGKSTLSGFKNLMKGWVKENSPSDRTDPSKINKCLSYVEFLKLKKGGTDNSLFFEKVKSSKYDIQSLAQFKKEFIGPNSSQMRMGYHNYSDYKKMHPDNTKMIKSKFFGKRLRSRLYAELLNSNPLLVHVFDEEFNKQKEGKIQLGNNSVSMYDAFMDAGSVEAFMELDGVREALVKKDTGNCEGQAKKLEKILCNKEVPLLPMNMAKEDMGSRWWQNKKKDASTKEGQSELFFINEVYTSKAYCNKAYNPAKPKEFDANFEKQEAESDAAYKDLNLDIRLASDFEHEERDGMSDYKRFNEYACGDGVNYCKKQEEEEGEDLSKCVRFDYQYKRSTANHVERLIAENYPESEAAAIDKEFFDLLSRMNRLNQQDKERFREIRKKLGLKKLDVTAMQKIWNFNKNERNRETAHKERMIAAFEDKHQVKLDRANWSWENGDSFSDLIEKNADKLEGYDNFKNVLGRRWTGDADLINKNHFTQQFSDDETSSTTTGSSTVPEDVIGLEDIFVKVEPTNNTDPVGTDTGDVLADASSQTITPVEYVNTPKKSLAGAYSKMIDDMAPKIKSAGSSAPINNRVPASSSNFEPTPTVANSNYEDNSSSYATNTNTNSNIGSTSKYEPTPTTSSSEDSNKSYNSELDKTLADLRAEANSMKNEVSDLRKRSNVGSTGPTYNNSNANLGNTSSAPTSAVSNAVGPQSNSRGVDSDLQALTDGDQFDNQETSAGGAQSVTGAGSGEAGAAGSASGGAAASGAAGGAGGVAGAKRGPASVKGGTKKDLNAYEFEKIIPHSAISQQGGGLKELVTLLQLEGKRFSTYEKKDGETVERVYDFYPLDSEGKPKMTFLKSKEKREKLIKTINKLRKSGTSSELLAKVAEQTRLVETKNLLDNEKEEIKSQMLSDRDVQELMQQLSRK